ncbi:unnamed protein product [Adineta steineri]|uniref:F-box domain-containing protein n=1 Tax=Adineta steineri TaxID=433720 RepID=A0A813QKU1_9BILA|nr:unnamed protein product [Adineta steineri]CAF0769512.1 unnamed protein product [Adineta steineri]CAF3550644.1 unnamed protein product [Adineta steineri]CAF4136856.1 unnamed protein product [Adineta steineri]
MTITILEDLSIELFYEIFNYFQFHEVFNIFSNLNSRFAAIINNMPLMPVYLGLNTMSIRLTEFYHIHLSQSNICHRLISLCVSDEFAFDNGLWLSKHLSTFINLRHLSLIDMKRSTFESILSECLSNTSLVMFSIRFTTYCRAAYTYVGVPEGAYYERIFHLFPFLRICDLQFWRYIYNNLDNQIILPLNQVFITVKTSHFNLQSIVIRECSLVFLLHLLEHLPQLQDLSFGLSTLWLPDKHPLKNNINNRVSNINKHLLPNLRRLKITLNNGIGDIEPLDQLFGHDVLFSLTNFTLLGVVSGSKVVRNLLSMLSHQCSYTLMVNWCVETMISLSDTSTILLNTFRQLQSRIPIELKLSLHHHSYSIAVLTIPQIKKTLYANEYIKENIVRAQSRCSSNVPMILNNRSIYINKIYIDCGNIEMNDEYLSYLPNIISWYTITSLTINDPLDSCQLRCLVSKMINLRTLELNGCYNNKDANSNTENLITFLNNISLCNIRMSYGLQKLYFDMSWEISDMIGIASLIVKQFPQLQIIEFGCHNSCDIHLPEALHILINGLPKLNFLIFHGGLKGGKEQYSKMRDLWRNSMRPYRMEWYIPSIIIDVPVLYFWLQ